MLQVLDHTFRVDLLGCGRVVDCLVDLCALLNQVLFSDLGLEHPGHLVFLSPLSAEAKLSLLAHLVSLSTVYRLALSLHYFGDVFAL